MGRPKGPQNVPYCRPVARKTAPAPTIGSKVKRRQLMLEVREEAAEFSKGLRRNLDPAVAVQQVLDNIGSLYEYATQQVMTLAEDEYWVETIAGKSPSEWLREQERLGLQMVHVAGKAAAMGLAERAVRLQEAQAAIFAAVVEQALVQAGVDGETRREIHDSVSRKLDDIVGTATEIHPRELAA